MGYPMTYQRVVGRNRLQGDYDHGDDAERRILAGDLRRLEHDQRDPLHLDLYAHAAGITPEQAKRVLDLLFDGNHGPGTFGLSFEEYMALHRKHFSDEHFIPGNI